MLTLQPSGNLQLWDKVGKETKGQPYVSLTYTPLYNHSHTTNFDDIRKREIVFVLLLSVFIVIFLFVFVLFYCLLSVFIVFIAI